DGIVDDVRRIVRESVLRGNVLGRDVFRRDVGDAGVRNHRRLILHARAAGRVHAGADRRQSIHDDVELVVGRVGLVDVHEGGIRLGWIAARTDDPGRFLDTEVLGGDVLGRDVFRGNVLGGNVLRRDVFRRDVLGRDVLGRDRQWIADDDRPWRRTCA